MLFSNPSFKFLYILARKDVALTNSFPFRAKHLGGERIHQVNTPLLCQKKDYIYIIECKLDGSADEALRQIEQKGYAKPYATDPRKLFKIGINFSSEIRGISEWKVNDK